MTRDDCYRAMAAALPHPQGSDAAAVSSQVDGAWYDLGHLGVLGMRGRDAAKFLQGYLTCDVNSLAPGCWLHGALCNLQGRMVGNFIVTGNAEAVLMRMPSGVLPAVRQLLAKYAVFAKAKLADETDAWVGIGLAGTAAAAALARLGIDAPAAAGARVSLDDGELLARGDARWELWLSPAAGLAAWNTLRTLLRADDIAAWHGADIAAGLPWVQAGTSGEYLPQLFNLDRTDGVNFRKGCYLGQEIVTRLQHRGEVKRRTARLAVPAGSVEGETVLDQDGRKVGTLVLVGRASNGDTEALAVMDRVAPDRVAPDRVSPDRHMQDRSVMPLALATARGPVEFRILPYALSDEVLSAGTPPDGS